MKYRLLKSERLKCKIHMNTKITGKLFQMLEQEGCSELLLYGKNSQNWGSHSNVRIARFEGNLVRIMVIQ